MKKAGLCEVVIRVVGENACPELVNTEGKWTHCHMFLNYRGRKIGLTSKQEQWVSPGLVLMGS